jgi:D-glycero-D-manno-heptose 1,7-bisphosphate phosphatase
MTAVLLDRDGVINRNRSDYVKSWQEFEFLPGALDALRALAERQVRVVVVSNQSAVGRGIIARRELDRINGQMLAMVSAHGGRIDGVLCCPHAPGAACACRKPRPGLLLEALSRFRLDPGHSYMVGDAMSDLDAARSAGIHFVMVLSGQTMSRVSRSAFWGYPLVHVTRDLKNAVDWILRREGL